jgi:hypothetical protein
VKVGILPVKVGILPVKVGMLPVKVGLLPVKVGLLPVKSKPTLPEGTDGCKRHERTEPEYRARRAR